jgi:hypothetical protein
MDLPCRLYLCRMQLQDDLQVRWWKLESKLLERFGKKPDMEAILFLIPGGYYALERTDEDGWPHYRQLKDMPVMSPIEQENFLKDYVLLYFENNGF